MSSITAEEIKRLDGLWGRADRHATEFEIDAFRNALEEAWPAIREALGEREELRTQLDSTIDSLRSAAKARDGAQAEITLLREALEKIDANRGQESESSYVLYRKLVNSANIAHTALSRREGEADGQ